MAISQIPALLWHPLKWYFIPTLRAHHLADQVLAVLTPYPMVISQISVKFIFHSYSESSTFGRPGLGRSTLHQMAILQIPALIWVLIFGRPLVKWWFGRFLWNSYFINTLRAQHLTDQVLAQLTPSSKAISQIPTLVWELIFGRPSVGRITPCQMAISQIPALTAHIWWQLIFHSHSESSTFGRPGLGRSTPHFWVAISLIPTLTTLISFLLWELIIWKTRSWQIYHPLFERQFHWFLLWQLLFHSTLRAYHLADQVLADLLTTSNGNSTDSYSDNSYFIPTLRAYHLADQVLTDLPPMQWWFHRFLLWQLTTLRAQHLADQVLADIPPHQMAILQIPALLWELIFGRPSVGTSTPHKILI